MESTPVVVACLDAEQLELAAIASQHAGESAPQTRVWLYIMRQAVRANHAEWVRHDAADITLIHRKINSACRLHRFGHDFWRLTTLACQIEQ